MSPLAPLSNIVMFGHKLLRPASCLTIPPVPFLIFFDDWHFSLCHNMARGGLFFFKRKSLQVIPCLKPSKGFHCPSERLFPAPPGPSRLRPCSPLQPQLGLPPPPALTFSHPGLLNSIPTGSIPKPPGKFLPLPASPPPCSKQHFGAGCAFLRPEPSLILPTPTKLHCRQHPIWDCLI